MSRIIPAAAPDRDGAGIDLPGVLLSVPAIALALYAFVGAGDAGWLSAATLVPLGLAFGLLGAFVWRERTARAPLIRLGILADRALSSGLLLIVSASALLAGSFFLVSLYLQRIVGLTPLEAGFIFLPVALALIAGAQAGSALVAHAGGRIATIFGLIVGSVGLSLLARVPIDGNVLVDVLPGFVLAGVGIGATLVAAMTTAFVGVKDEDAGLASGLVNTSHEGRLRRRRVDLLRNRGGKPQRPGRRGLPGGLPGRGRYGRGGGHRRSPALAGRATAHPQSTVRSLSEPASMLDMTAPMRTRRRRSDAERSIAAIVGAAVDAFGRRSDVSMSEIATAAGVGRVTLYAHFPSRRRSSRRPPSASWSRPAPRLTRPSSTGAQQSRLSVGWSERAGPSWSGTAGSLRPSEN